MTKPTIGETAYTTALAGSFDGMLGQIIARRTLNLLVDKGLITDEERWAILEDSPIATKAAFRRLIEQHSAEDASVIAFTSTETLLEEGRKLDSKE